MEQECSAIQEIEAQIKQELASEIDENKGSKQITEQNVGRKPFRIRDFDIPRDREMAVFTHAKKLSEYIFVVTEKSPVKYRWNIVSRLLDTSVEVIEDLYRANFEKGAERVVWQKQAMTALNLLDFYAETAKTKQAITFRQMTIIARQICEVKKLLGGWVRSTKPKNCEEKSTDNA